MFYYSHHIGDFIKDTSNLDDHHLATYLRMMWVYYTEEKPLSDDVDDIAFAVRSDEKTVRLLLRHFFQKVGNEWHHNRCDREIAEYHGKSEKARNSANARWKNAKAMQTHSERNANEPVFDANQEPITNNQEPSIKKEKKGASAEIVYPDGLDQTAWTRWVEYRKLSGKALRPVSWQSAIDALVKHGPNQMAVVEQSIANGWQGLFALKKDGNKQSQSMTFAERDAAAGRKRWEEMTGRKWPENETWIDIETFTLGIEHDTTD
jgi:uncharacterized protein YdaU (DUF1376 family)